MGSGDTPGTYTSDGIWPLAGDERLGGRPNLEHRAAVGDEGRLQIAERYVDGPNLFGRSIAQLGDERNELRGAGRTRQPRTGSAAARPPGGRCTRAAGASSSLPLPPPAPAACCLGGCREQVGEGGLDRGVVRSATSSSTGRVGRGALGPLAVGTLGPEDVLEPVGDGEAAVGGALGHDPLGPEVHREMRPVVLAGGEVVPAALELLRPGLVRDEAPEGGLDEHDPVVEVGVPERGDPADLVGEGAELGDDGVLGGELGPLLRGRVGTRLLDEARLTALLERELGRDDVPAEGEQAVAGEPVGVAPGAVSG